MTAGFVADGEGGAGQDGMLGEEEVATFGEDVEAVYTHVGLWRFCCRLQ